MTKTYGTTRRFIRALAIGAVAIGVSAAALPSDAAASARGGGYRGPHQIAYEIDRIAYQVREVAELRNPWRQDARIDRLQHRLVRLEAITNHQRGRLARRNDQRIDRLQARLYRMERRAERRIDRHGHPWRPVHYGYRR